MPAEDLARLSWLLGIDPSSADARDRRLVDAVQAGLSVQLSRETLAATAQAYARGLGRIVAAEADNVRRLVAELPRAERAPFVDEALTTILEPAEAFLGALHHV